MFRLHKERVKRHHEDQSQAYPPPQGGLPMVPIPPQRSQYANDDHNAYRVSDILGENHENRNYFMDRQCLTFWLGGIQGPLQWSASY